jgi:hypothetical protein
MNDQSVVEAIRIILRQHIEKLSYLRLAEKSDDEIKSIISNMFRQRFPLAHNMTDKKIFRALSDALEDNHIGRLW